MTLEDHFLAFDSDNPHVYTALKGIAISVKQQGRSQWGMGALFERLRWVSEFDTQGDPYKLNNNYRAFYARKLMADVPELVGFFGVREQQYEAA